jgi:hypothetical protein
VCALGFMTATGANDSPCDCAAEVVTSVSLRTASGLAPPPDAIAALVAALAEDLRNHFLDSCPDYFVPLAVPFALTLHEPLLQADVEVFALTPIGADGACSQRDAASQCLLTALLSPCIPVPLSAAVLNSTTACVAGVLDKSSVKFSPCASDAQLQCPRATSVVVGAPAPPTTQAPPDEQAPAPGLGIGALIGIIAGALIFVIFVGVLCAKYCRFFVAGFRKRMGWKFDDPNRNNLVFNIAELADDEVLEAKAQTDDLASAVAMVLPGAAGTALGGRPGADGGVDDTEMLTAAQAFAAANLQDSHYLECWSGFKKHFNPAQK